MDGFIPADWGGAFAGGFGFASAFLVFKALWGAVQWAITFKTGREDRREDRVEAGTQKHIERLQGEVDRLSEECVKLRERADANEDEARASREKHAECEARVKQLEATFQGYGDAKQLAALQAAAQHQSAKEQDKGK